MMTRFQQIGAQFDRVRNAINRNNDITDKELSNHQAQIDKLVTEGDSSPQAAAASVGVDGTTYGSLKTRLDAEQNAIANRFEGTASVSYVDAILASIGNGAPREAFFSLAALIATYPNGANGPMLVFDSRHNDGAHTYIWNAQEQQWKDIGAYQGVSVLDGTITIEKISDEALSFNGQKVTNKGFNNVQIGLKFAYDIRGINFINKKAKFSFKFHTPDSRASTFHARYRLSNQLNGLVNPISPFNENDGMINLVDTEVIYDYKDNEKTGIADADYLFCYIWINLKSQISDFSYFYRAASLTIDGAKVEPILIEPHGGSIITERVSSLDRQLATVGQTRTLTEDTISRKRDFNGIFSSLYDFNNVYFAIRYVVDARSFNLNGNKIDVTFRFNAENPNIERVQTRYRISSSPTELTNPVNPLVDGQAITPVLGEIHSYSDIGRTMSGNGNYLFVYIWVPLKGNSNYSSIFHTVPSVKLDGVEQSFTTVGTHNGLLSQTDVKTLPSQLLTRKNKYETTFSKFSNLTLNVIGDSITKSNGGFTNKYWHNYVQDELQFKQVNNYGIGGSTVGKKDGGTDNNPIIDRYSSMADADYIGIFAGTNDYSREVELGTIDSRDNSTFYGAYHNLILGLIDKYPGKKLFMMTPLPRSLDTPRGDSPYSLFEYADAVKKIAAFHSVPCLDLYYASNLHPKNAVFVENFMPDGVHPNEEGHKIFASKVLAFIKSI